MKTTFQYDHYFQYEELASHLHELAKDHEDIMKLESIGTTPKGREVFAITLSDGDSMKKPAYYIDGNTHAGEVTGSMAAMHTIDYLATNYGVEESVTSLLKEYTIYVIPRISPDGAEAYLSSWAKLRSVDRPYLTKEQEDGLYNQDIDGDNVLRLMRVKTPYGAWKQHPDNPNLVVKRKPDDKAGPFYNIYSEGEIKGYDGMNIRNANPLWGYDFNRSYPYGWFSEVRQPGAGPYPLSNMENKAVVDFVLSHQNIGGVCTHHTHGGIILYPPGTRPEKTVPALDRKVLKEIGKVGEEETGYDVVPIFDSFMTDQENYSSGAFDDWCYQQNGIPAYTIEIWNMAKLAGVETSWPPKPKTDEQEAQDYQKMIDWCMENAPEAFKPWTTYTHPQLGEVEIGGLDTKYTLQNPPAHMLQGEIEKVTKMCLRMAQSLPELCFDSVNTTAVGENTYKIEAVVANKGYLPTYLTKQTKTMGIESPVVVEAASTAAIVSCAKVELGSLEGFSGIPTGYRFDGIYTGNSDPIMKKATFYVTGSTGDTVTIKAYSNKTGEITTTITL